MAPGEAIFSFDRFNACKQKTCDKRGAGRIIFIRKMYTAACKNFYR